MKKTFSLSDSVCLYKNIKELSCANLDEEFVFFGCRRMLIHQKFIKSKGRAILGEEDIFSQRQHMLIHKYKKLSCANLDEEFVFFGCRRMLIRQSQKNGLFAKGASSTSISPFPSYAIHSEHHRYHRTCQASSSCC